MSDRPNRFIPSKVIMVESSEAAALKKEEEKQRSVQTPTPTEAPVVTPAAETSSTPTPVEETSSTPTPGQVPTATGRATFEWTLQEPQAVLLPMENVLEGRLGNLLEAAVSMGPQGTVMVAHLKKLVEMQFSELVKEDSEEEHNLELEISDLKKELAVIKSKYARSRRALSRKIEKAVMIPKPDNREHIEKIAALTEAKEKLANENSVMKREYEKVVETLTQYKREHKFEEEAGSLSMQQQRNRAHQLLNNYRASAEEMKNRINQLTEENARLTKESKLIDVTPDNLMESVDKLIEENTRLKSEVGELKSQNDTVSASKTHFQCTCASLGEENANLTRQVADLNYENAKISSHIVSRISQLAQKEKEIKRLQDTIKTIKQVMGQ